MTQISPPYHDSNTLRFKFKVPQFEKYKGTNETELAPPLYVFWKMAQYANNEPFSPVLLHKFKVSEFEKCNGTCNLKLDLHMYSERWRNMKTTTLCSTICSKICMALENEGDHMENWDLEFMNQEQKKNTKIEGDKCNI